MKVVRFGEWSEGFDPSAEGRGWIYRLWDAWEQCLYVGQTTQWHPLLRIAQHRNKPWWREVKRVDWAEPLNADLDEAEQDMINKLNPRYNGGFFREANTA